jgi:DNA-binding NarL/FixJ family response regulator
MDVEMPVMDGISATTEIKARAPRCSVVVLSLYDDAATRARAAAAGACAFVAKTKMDETLVDAIRTAGCSPLPG